VAAVIGLPGAIFLLQGLGVPIGRSFMIGDPTWDWIGGAMLVIALGIAAGPSLGRRRRR